MDTDLFTREDLPTDTRFDRKALTVGTELMVVDGVPGYRRGGDDPVKVVVTEKARIWITVEEVGGGAGGRRWPRTWRFRLDDQTDGASGAYSTRFYTPEQYLIRSAAIQATRYLDGERIRVEYDSPWRTDFGKIQLARIIWSDQQG